MGSKYTCHKEGCEWEIELFWYDGDDLTKILKHEAEHKAKTKEVTKTEREDCTKCDGKGYIEYTYTVDEDVSETD